MSVQDNKIGRYLYYFNFMCYAQTLRIIIFANTSKTIILQELLVVYYHCISTDI